MIKLRPYQDKAVNRLRYAIVKGKNKLILCSPTGSGKTIIFCYMVSRAIAKGKKVLIVTDRTELLTQAGGSLEKFNLNPIEIKPGRNFDSLDGQLYTGMAQTLQRRIKKEQYREFLEGLDLIILDEAHKQSFNSLLPLIPEKTTVIGATATPHREKNQDSLSDFYDEIIEVCDIKYLVDNGYLSSPVSYGVEIDLSGIKKKQGEYDSKSMGGKFNEIKLYEGVYDNYIRITPGKKALIFAPSVESSIKLVDDFSGRGLPIRHIDAKTPKNERKSVLKWFNDTPNAIISNVGILTAGFDQPDIEVVILYRATTSLPLFLQMVGRGSRITNTKDKFTILDFGNNIKRHGFWEQPRKWSLQRPDKSDKEGEAPVKICKSCGGIVHTTIKICPYCGFEFPQEKNNEAVVAKLQKLSYKEVEKVVEEADFETLLLIAKAKGYKMNWIYHQLTTENQLRDFAKFMGYKPGWVYMQFKKLREKKNANRI